MRKIFSVMLVCILLVTMVQNDSYAEPSFWATTEIALASQKGLLTKRLENKLQQPITRSEFSELAVIFANLLLPVPLSARDIEGVYLPFYDVEATDYSVKLAYDMKIVNGLTWYTFGPNQQVTRQEIATMLNRAIDLVVKEYKLVDKAGQDTYAMSKEGANTPSWAVDGVKALIGLGVLKGNGVDYGLTQATTSEQAIILVYRLFKTIANNGEPYFTDSEVARIKEIKAYKTAYFTPIALDGSIYEAIPKWQDSYLPGKLKKTVLDNGLKAINYTRYLAKLPFDVTMTEASNAEAQHGPLVMAANNQFTHHPTNVIGMPEDLFERGRRVTATANIGLGFQTKANVLYDFNLSCIDDSDNYNIDRVGHRRWLLNPNLKEVGMGVVDAYTATKVFDRSRQQVVQPDYVAWPSEGVFPLDSQLINNNLAWSLSVSNGWYEKKVYEVSYGSAIWVRMTRLSDNRVWEFKQKGHSDNNKYFNIDAGGYGYGPAIIFRPDIDTYNNGDEFLIEIINIENASTRSPETITYRVKFFQ